MRRTLAIGLVAVGLLAANAASAYASPSAPRILIPYDCAGTPPATLQSQVLAQPGIAGVDVFDANAATPTVDQLRGYDVVVPVSDCSWNDAVAMGNNLADYQDAGGVVVGTTFVWQDSGSYTLGGRWITDGYSPYETGAAQAFGDATLAAHDASNPLLAGVSALMAYYRDDVVLSDGATEIAQWSDGTSAVAFKGRAVGINAYLGDQSGPAYSGDFARIILNAAPLPSNDFSAGVKRKMLLVGVSAPGSVTVADAAAPLSASSAKKKRRLLLKPSSASGNPPTITVPLRLTKFAKQLLRLKGKVTVRARVTYTPQRGTSNTKILKLKVKGKKK
jgi:hypothetical protein